MDWFIFKFFKIKLFNNRNLIKVNGVLNIVIAKRKKNENTFFFEKL